MLRMKTETLEFRGLASMQSAKGNAYSMLYCERADGEAVEFYLREVPDGASKLKKGDKVVVYLARNKYKDLLVVDVVKADGSN